MSRIDEQASKWLTRMRSGQAGPAEVAAFESWHEADSRHAGAYLRAEAAWTMLDRAQVLTHGDDAPTLDDHVDILSTPLIHSIVPAPRKPSRRWLLTGGAAVAASAAAGFVLMGRLSFRTGHGELRKVPLSDHSVAAINTDSEIDVAMNTSLRHVSLVKGEAWFEVAKNPDAPFVVSVGDIRVRAVGTAFGVRRHSKGVEVLVTEGTVETWTVHDPAKRTQLTEGHAAFVPASTDPAKTVAVAFEPDEVSRRLAWRDREIILRNESLSDAAAEFNRYNDQQIVVSDAALKDAKLVGGFQVDQPESFARAVHAALNVPVSIRHDRIIIGTVGDVG